MPCIIKNPPLRDIPTRETESFSPLALGYSMMIDYKRRRSRSASTCPRSRPTSSCRCGSTAWRWCRAWWTARTRTSFVVDTGGEVISISQAVAASLGRPEGQRRIALQVYGTSGWDRDAFLLPGVNLAFDRIHYDNYSVVVLNLQAPSALLGFQLGGIVGHQFLSQYRVGIDLERSVAQAQAQSRIRRGRCQALQLSLQALGAAGVRLVAAPRSSSVSSSSGGTAARGAADGAVTNVR